MSFFFFFFLGEWRRLFSFFFFSSRRRHTRSLRDWSSDVCSSDLRSRFGGAPRSAHALGREPWRRGTDAEGALRRDERRVGLPRPRGQSLVAREPGPAFARDGFLRGSRLAASRRAPLGRSDPRGVHRRSPAARRRLYRTEPFLGTNSRTGAQLERSRGRHLLRFARGSSQSARAVMNFQAYKEVARGILASEAGPRLVRLDCMNP